MIGGPVGLGPRFGVGLLFLTEGFGPGLLFLCVLMPLLQHTIREDWRTFDLSSITRLASYMIARLDAFRPKLS